MELVVIFVHPNECVFLEIFLRFDANKAELFLFLASVLESAVTHNHKTTMGEKVVSRNRLDVTNFQLCTHEEEYYHIMLHSVLTQYCTCSFWLYEFPTSLEASASVVHSGA